MDTMRILRPSSPKLFKRVNCRPRKVEKRGNTENVADLIDSGSVADEGGKDDVDTLLNTETEVGPVFLGDGRQIDVSAGQIDALLAAEQTAVLDLAEQEIISCIVTTFSSKS